ncbi:MAG: pyridoxamine 5'-phosphate oxidase family protein [Alphaproteobacteria bacterium]
MTQSLKTPRTTLKRSHERGEYDREKVYGVLDDGLFCHVGYVHDGHPFVTPTAHWRAGDELIIHGSAASRMMRVLAAGGAACITVTHVDGLVLARSAFHHSVNYRSVMVLGKGRLVDEGGEKIALLEALIDRIAPGRWATLRPHTEQEIKATSVLAFAIDEASAKIRTGPPIDDEEDYELAIWAGIVPLVQQVGAAVPCPRLDAGMAIPRHVAAIAKG